MLQNWEDAVASKPWNDSPRTDEKANKHSEESDIGQITLNEASPGKLFVGAFEEMRSFYQAVFDITPQEAHYGEERNQRACTFNLPSRHLVIIETPAADEANPHDPQKLQELEFDVAGDENMDALYEKLKCIYGCQVKQFPHFTRNHYYQLIVSDPENNTLIFRS